jgi:hypothetical protein
MLCLGSSLDPLRIRSSYPGTQDDARFLLEIASRSRFRAGFDGKNGFVLKGEAAGGLPSLSSAAWGWQNCKIGLCRDRSLRCHSGI